MNTLPTVCPFCGGELVVTHLHCRECDSHIEGRFSLAATPQVRPEHQEFYNRFISRLQSEQLAFVETFIRCEGKIKNMEVELGLSYPTIRNRLDEVVRALGYEPDLEEQPAGITDERRQTILEDLDAGKISAEDAMRLLKESEA